LSETELDHKPPSHRRTECAEKLVIVSRYSYLSEPQPQPMQGIGASRTPNTIDPRQSTDRTAESRLALHPDLCKKTIWPGLSSIFSEIQWDTRWSEGAKRRMMQPKRNKIVGQNVSGVVWIEDASLASSLKRDGCRFAQPHGILIQTRSASPLCLLPGNWGPIRTCAAQSNPWSWGHLPGTNVVHLQLRIAVQGDRAMSDKRQDDRATGRDGGLPLTARFSAALLHNVALDPPRGIGRLSRPAE
jgi:hypothetical protein